MRAKEWNCIDAILCPIEIGFLEAGIDSRETVNDAVRPDGYVLANEEEDEDESMEESRRGNGTRDVVMPSKEEYEEHMQTHIPFRKWCPFAANPKTGKSLGEDSEVPIIGWDPMEQKTKEDLRRKGSEDIGRTG